jgi:hypothetical protein
LLTEIRKNEINQIDTGMIVTIGIKCQLKDHIILLDTYTLYTVDICKHSLPWAFQRHV